MSADVTIGVDLGGTKMLTGVVDSGRTVLYESRKPSVGLSEDEVVELLVSEVTAARDEHPEAAAVGLGIPATIDHEHGVAIQAVNLPMDDVPVREILAERVGLPAFVDNDATVAALAEHTYGAGRGTTNMVLITVGTGIGGGIIIGGEIYRGSIGAGAELGHMVIDINGPRCQGNCPGNGCIEAVASGTAIGREGREAAEREPDSALGKALAAGEEVDGATVSEAALAGDAAARGVLELVGTRLGIAFSNYANIFEPDAIVVGGGAMSSGDLILEPARAELRRRALPPMNETPVKPAELGPSAGLIGAAELARSEHGAS